MGLFSPAAGTPPRNELLSLTHTRAREKHRERLHDIACHAHGYTSHGYSMPQRGMVQLVLWAHHTPVRADDRPEPHPRLTATSQLVPCRSCAGSNRRAARPATPSSGPATRQACAPRGSESTVARRTAQWTTPTRADRRAPTHPSNAGSTTCHRSGPCSARRLRRTTRTRCCRARSCRQRRLWVLAAHPARPARHAAVLCAPSRRGCAPACSCQLVIAHGSHLRVSPAQRTNAQS